MTNRNYSEFPLSDKEKAQAIKMALDVKNTFEMYAYRIIPNEVFHQTMVELARELTIAQTDVNDEQGL